MYCSLTPVPSQSAPPLAQELPAVAVQGDATACLGALPIVRLRFTAVFGEALDWPAHGGALLRGVFGAALRQGVCNTGLPRCAECPLRPSCAYPAIFETPPAPTQFAQRFDQVPNPYVIEPPAGPMRLRAGAPLVFHMVLLGQATLKRLALVHGAWQRALSAGLGQRRVPGRLVAVDAVTADGRIQPLLDDTHRRLSARPDELPRLELPRLQPMHGPTHGPTQYPAPQALRLEMQSPVRLQRDGKPLRPAELTPRAFLAPLLRRLNLVLDLHLDIRPAPFDARALLAQAERVEHDVRALRWVELGRYSARQDRSFPQGGLLGPWLWRGELGDLLPWLLLGQWLHVGKGATAGLGAYRVLAVDAMDEAPGA